MYKASFVLPNWPAPKNVRAFTTCRESGFSLPPYDSLNIAQHVGDNETVVAQNRLLLPHSQYFVWLNQTHSNICLNLDKHDLRMQLAPQADACFSQSKQKVCAVMTADCLPILLCNQQGSCVAAIHAGWRGLADGVIETTLSSMPVESNSLMAWIGPAISQANFEVGIEVKEAFSLYPEAFIANPQSTTGKYLADLSFIAKTKLRGLGIRDIYSGDYCTYRDGELFFSHRRAVHKKIEQEKGIAATGRMVSAIYLI